MHPAIVRACAVLRPVGCVTEEVAALATRLLMLHVFSPTGWGKLHNLEAVTGFFRDLGIPAPGVHAAFIGGLEFVGGILLALGLATRPIAFLLGCTMVVALATAHRGDVAAVLPLGGDDKTLMDIAPVPLLMGLLWLMGHGAGRLSLDRLVWRRCGAACAPTQKPA